MIPLMTMGGEGQMPTLSPPNNATAIRYAYFINKLINYLIEIEIIVY